MQAAAAPGRAGEEQAASDGGGASHRDSGQAAAHGAARSGSGQEGRAGGNDNRQDGAGGGEQLAGAAPHAPAAPPGTVVPAAAEGGACTAADAAPSLLEAVGSAGERPSSLPAFPRRAVPLPCAAGALVHRFSSSTHLTVSAGHCRTCACAVSHASPPLPPTCRASPPRPLLQRCRRRSRSGARAAPTARRRRPRRRRQRRSPPLKPLSCRLQAPLVPPSSAGPRRSCWARWAASEGCPSSPA